MTKLRRIPLVALAALALSLGACRSKLDVKSVAGPEQPGTVQTPPADVPTSSPATPPGGDPNVTPPGAGGGKTEVRNALATRGGRKFYQTREPIYLEVAKEVIAGGDSWQLVNMDPADPENEAMAKLVMEGAVPDEMALTDSGGFALVAASADRMMMVIPPNSEARKAIRYGANMLRFRTNVGNYTDTEVVQKDFDVFGVAVTLFADNQQVAVFEGGYQFQGWVDTVTPAVVTAPVPCAESAIEDEKEAGCGAVTLSQGLFNIINPR